MQSVGMGGLAQIHLLQVMSVLLFSAGFFLTRPEIHTKSPGTDATAQIELKRFNKTVILLIDALRYDFACPVPSVYCPREMEKYTSVEPFHNNLPFIAESLRNEPDRNLLLKFIADPPTTTMQRIKGIVTGSLPTFIDLSRNFGSDRLEEDNLLYQLQHHKRLSVFMGDDTWMGLLGDHFQIKYPFPSFNVMDLDTVDSGVVRHLLPEIQNKSSGWNLIVAHFLGLDHAGHRYTLNNSAIVHKLRQYNSIIKSVSDAMDRDTLLVVMGDHGMTVSGDHGGDTPSEVESALFLSSKQPHPLTSNSHNSRKSQHVSHSPQPRVNMEVSQIDLVSTLSLLMGVPIPFSNLGTVIPHLFASNHSLNKALDANIAQVTRFMDVEGSTLPSLSGDTSKLSTIDDKLKFLREVSSAYRGLWATFDIPLIVLGVASMVNACLLHICFVHYQMKPVAEKKGNNGAIYQNGNCSYESSHRLFNSHRSRLGSLSWRSISKLDAFSGVGTSLFGLCASFYYQLHIAALAALTLWFSIRLSKSCWTHAGANIRHVLFLLCPGVVYGVISGSNSFILNEPLCLIYLINALLLFVVLIGGKSPNFKLSSTLYSLVLVVICNVVTRTLIVHPESQEVNPLLQPLSSLEPDESHKRLILTSVLLIAFVLLTIKNLIRSENLISDHLNLTTSWFFVALPLSTFSIILYWSLSSQSHSFYESQTDLIKILFPRITYLVVVIAFVSFICDPNLVHVKSLSSPKLPEISLADFNSSDPTKIIPQLAKTLFPAKTTPLSKRTEKNGSLTNRLTDKKLENGSAQNGFLKSKAANHSTESSRSSSISNMSSRSKSSTGVSPNLNPIATGTAVVANGRQGHSNRKHLQVQGLGSSVLASWHLVSTPVIMLLYLLVGNGPSISLSLMILHMQAICHLVSTSLCQKDQHNPVEQLDSSSSHHSKTENPESVLESRKEGERRQEGLDSTCVVAFAAGSLLALVGSYYFYVTGHQLAIASIRFETGYIGFLKDFNSFIVPGFLVTCNTFCAQIAALVFLPLAVYTRFSGTSSAANLAGSLVKSKLEMEGKFTTNFLDNIQCASRAMTILFAAFSLTHALKLLVTMMCSTLLRHHLMAYRIFVPNLMFQAVAFLVVLIVQMVLYLCHKWVTLRNSRFVDALNKLH